MREIKFRAWLVRKNKMRYSCEWDDLNFRTDGTPFRVMIGEQYNLIDYLVEFMQYTGLKDRNGKEIYEGDIIIGFCTGNHSTIVECEAPNGGFNLRDRDGEYIEIFHNEGGLEVIGNIYENPELLGVAKA